MLVNREKETIEMRRLLCLILAPFILMFAFASPAGAEPPVTVVGQTTPVDSRFCSFPVLRSDEFKLTTITKPDGTLITHISRTLTFTANGKTLSSNDHFTRFVDPGRPFLIDVAGHLIGVVLPGYGPILQEVGHFIIDARNPGSPIIEAGQHDTLDHDTAAFCAYFAS